MCALKAPGSPSQPANQVVDVVDVCQTPSHMGVRRTTVAGAPGTPARTQSRVFVACFLSNQVMVVDPDLAEVVETILSGSGPNDIAFNYGDGLDQPEPAHRRAFVSNFVESTLSVIDLEASEPASWYLVSLLGEMSRTRLTDEPLGVKLAAAAIDPG